MNAYELALQLEDFKCVYQGAEMLRQQAKRIEELEAKLQIHDAMDSRCKELMKQVKGLIK